MFPSWEMSWQWETSSHNLQQADLNPMGPALDEQKTFTWGGFQAEVTI